MKVLIASTVVPMVRGGGTIIVDSLAHAVRERGHEVDVLKLPFSDDPTRVFGQMLAMRLHHVEEAGDRLICIRTPAHLLRHNEKRLWFIHHYRAAYDLWGTPLGWLQDNPYGRSIRDGIIAADNVAFAEARAVYTNSREVSARLEEFNRVGSEVLYPPLDRPEVFRCDGYGDAIVYVSRLAPNKRQALAIEAMRYTTSDVKLIVAGPPDTSDHLMALKQLIRSLEVTDRVTLRPTWISNEEKADLFASCLAAVYCPFDEDSYGYPSLEAHESSKAVVSTTDAGGVEELVIDGHNGFLTEPTPQALAKAFDELFEDRALAEKMGCNGRERMRTLGISWDHVVESLVR